MKSNCCQSDMVVQMDLFKEGTCYYTCLKCNSPTDPDYGQISITIGCPMKGENIGNQSLKPIDHLVIPEMNSIEFQLGLKECSEKYIQLWQKRFDEYIKIGDKMSGEEEITVHKKMITFYVAEKNEETIYGVLSDDTNNWESTSFSLIQDILNRVIDQARKETLFEKTGTPFDEEKERYLPRRQCSKPSSEFDTLSKEEIDSLEQDFNNQKS